VARGDAEVSRGVPDRRFDPAEGTSPARGMNAMPDEFELSRRKALAALGTVGVASAGAGLGTSAFFSDQETFQNNQLTAGALDMKVSWEEQYSDWSEDEAEHAHMEDGELVVDDRQGFMEATLQEQFPDKRTRRRLDEGTADPCEVLADVPDDLEKPVIELEDVKPGDFGEVTFDFALCDNPGYVWLNGRLRNEAENGLTEPEADDPDEETGPELADLIEVELEYNPSCAGTFLLTPECVTPDSKEQQQTKEMCQLKIVGNIPPTCQGLFDTRFSRTFWVDCTNQGNCSVSFPDGVGDTKEIFLKHPDEAALCRVTVELLQDCTQHTTDNIWEVEDNWSKLMSGSLREALEVLSQGNGIPLDGNPATPFVEIDGDAPADGGVPTRECFTAIPDRHCIDFKWELPVDHGNEVQSDSVSFDLGFYTEQCRHNDGSGMNDERIGNDDDVAV